MGMDYVVVIVTFNRLALLRECVNHVENQTVKARTVIIVDNASTDGTGEYLREAGKENTGYRIIKCSENIGGAGGFEKGIEAASGEKADCILAIDDDAMLEKDYMEKILAARERHPKYSAFAGAVMTDGKIDTCHRRTVANPGLRLKNCPEELYRDGNRKGYFLCDIASFCGMVIDTRLIEKIGLPSAEYFIWFDDTEYSLRINRFTKFLVVPDARLEHKTTNNIGAYPHRRYDWREYYGIRNRILCVRKHGNVLDRMVNGADMFCNIVLRNRLFGAVKMDGYDWEYERRIVRLAYKDAEAGSFQNLIIKRNSDGSLGEDNGGMENCGTGSAGADSCKGT